MCLVDGYHKNHKWVKVQDQDKLSQLNSTLNKTTQEFSELISKTEKMKNSLEYEFSEIKELQETTMKKNQTFIHRYTRIYTKSKNK